MDQPPPCYAAAISRDPLPLIIPYLPRNSLLAASRACRHWHKVFSQAIWSCPEKWWKSDVRSGYMGFLHFLRTLNRLPEDSRPTTTHYTKSLSFHSAPASIYTVFEPTWLAALLSNLPYLEVLNVSNAPYFDHESLKVFGRQPPPICTLTLTTFIAHGCQNTTAPTLNLFLRVGWPALEHLDLSKTAGATHVVYEISQKRALPNLKRLVLRDLELKDPAIQTLAKGLGTRLELLDIRGNLISDLGIIDLLNYCFPPPDYDYSMLGLEYGTPPPPPPSDSGIEYSQPKGLSRLLISKNPRISWSSIECLIRTTRLVNFDCGMIPDLDKAPSNIPYGLPVSILSMYAHKHLRSLRISYRLICPTASPGNSPVTNTHPGRLKPAMLPNLRTLILCGVPHYTRPSSNIIRNLLQFLDNLAVAEGDAQKTFPNRRRKGLVYLKLLVLELETLSYNNVEGMGMYDSPSASGKKGDTSDGGDDIDGSDEDEDGDEEHTLSEKLKGDFSFFTGGEEQEGIGGDWREDATPVNSRIPKSTAGKSRKKEKQQSLLSELQCYREAGRKGNVHYWHGDIKVMRDLGWDDDGGVESGSVGKLKWGLVMDDL